MFASFQQRAFFKAFLLKLKRGKREEISPKIFCHTIIRSLAIRNSHSLSFIFLFSYNILTHTLSQSLSIQCMQNSMVKLINFFCCPPPSFAQLKLKQYVSTSFLHFTLISSFMLIRNFRLVRAGTSTSSYCVFVASSLHLYQSCFTKVLRSDI